MAEERREEIKEKITVLDEGIKDDALDSYWVCCAGPFTPYF